MASKPKVNIFYDKESNTYEFMESSVDKIDIEKEKGKIRPTVNEYDELRALIRSSGRNKEYYNSKISIQPIVGITPVKREFSGQIYTYNNLTKSLKEKKELDLSIDGNIIHLLPQHFEKGKIDINLLKRKMNNYGDNIVIAVPKNYDFNREHIIEYGTYKKLLNDEKYLENNRIRDFLDKEKKKYENILIEKINEYTVPNNFYFVFNDGIYEFNSFNDLFSYMLKHYSKFPNIESQ